MRALRPLEGFFAYPVILGVVGPDRQARLWFSASAVEMSDGNQDVESSKIIDQDILAYFTGPTRSIKHARIAAIRNGSRHAAINLASSKGLAS